MTDHSIVWSLIMLVAQNCREYQKVDKNDEGKNPLKVQNCWEHKTGGSTNMLEVWESSLTDKIQMC